MRGRKIPVDQRAKAVGIAVVSGIAEASRQTGISEPAIHKWYHSPEFEELRSRKPEVVAAEWWSGIQTAFRRAVELMDKTDDPVKAATTGAIMFDKMQMARGESVTRSEVTHFRDYNDHERRELSAALDTLLDGAAGDRAQTDSAEVRQ